MGLMVLWKKVPLVAWCLSPPTDPTQNRRQLPRPGTPQPGHRQHDAQSHHKWQAARCAHAHPPQTQHRKQMMKPMENTPPNPRPQNQIEFAGLGSRCLHGPRAPRQSGQVGFRADAVHFLHFANRSKWNSCGTHQKSSAKWAHVDANDVAKTAVRDCDERNKRCRTAPGTRVINPQTRNNHNNKKNNHSRQFRGGQGESRPNHLREAEKFLR